MRDDQELLRCYVQERSEDAFTELVSRHIDLVYATALRTSGGDTHLAEDVSQVVFTDLARKAQAQCLPRIDSLAGWLHRHASFTASKAVRTECRRQARETLAAAHMNDHDLPTGAHEETERMIPLMLDAALNELTQADREALVLRFLKQQDLRSVGAAFGIGEDAAQKRVSRALERLKAVLGRRGVALPVGGLAAVLTAQATVAAPAGLAASVAMASVAAATAGTGGGGSLFLLKLMAATKIKSGAVGALVVALGVLTPLVVWQGFQVQLRQQDDALRTGARVLAELEKENARLAGLVASANAGAEVRPSREQFTELLRLRGQIGSLRGQLQGLGTSQAGMSQGGTNEEAGALGGDLLARIEKEWAGRAEELRTWVQAHPEAAIPELVMLNDHDWVDAIYPFKLENEEERRRALSNVRANAELRVLGQFSLALRRYADANGGQYPARLEELTPYLSSQIDGAMLKRYEIVRAESLVSDLRGTEPWVITQRAPVDAEWDSRLTVGREGGGMADSRVAGRWGGAR